MDLAKRAITLGTLTGYEPRNGAVAPVTQITIGDDVSKKDFIALADALRESRPLFGQKDNRLKQWQQDVETVAQACQSSNPRFMRERWLGYIAGECGSNGGKVK